jgi:hypothetical protein
MSYGNQVSRDTTNKIGGTPGVVNSTTTAISVNGKLNTDYEWTALTIANNYADAGENCSTYHQANAYGKGPTWAACNEVSDIGEQGATLIATELDVFCTGPDNGRRIGLDVAVGDTRAIHGKPPSPYSEATVGVRVASVLYGPAWTWRDAVELTNFRRSGVRIVGTSSASSAILAEGTMATLLDAQGAKYPVFAKIASVSGAFVGGSCGAQVGYLRILIDGSEYALPLHYKE